jgi:hypothetical protein
MKTFLCGLGKMKECSARHPGEDMKRNMFPALALTVAVLPLLVPAVDGCRDLTVTPAAGTPSMAEMTSGSFMSTNASGHLAPEETSPSEPLAAGAASGPANTKKQTTTLYPVVTGLVVAPNLSMPSRYEDGDPHLVWDGTWDTGAGAPFSGSYLTFTNSPGAAVWVAFSGTSISCISGTNNTCGLASVRLDGGLPETVDLYSPSESYQVTVWQYGTLASGTHTVTIECTGR